MTIAITGHRDVVVDAKLQEDVEAFFSDLEKKYGSLTFLSPLAEGADMLTAEIFLKHSHGNLEVPLPFAQEDYMQDFSAIDKERFEALSKKAKRLFVVPKVCEHPFENLGKYIVDNADIILALWDGTYNGAKGGTGEVVKYAKAKNRVVFHILCERKNV